jgi:SAM-dependent methyltransferase
MTQIIYDDQTFFANYSQLPRSVEGLAGAPEWPSLRALLPRLEGLRVLDLGCGFGWFCRFARTEGARQVLGVDASERMLARAQAETRDPAVTYQRVDLEEFTPAPQSFDLAYSSLAFHYVVAFDELLARVHAALVPGSRLVFSVEHPINTAPIDQKWLTNEAGQRVWQLRGYLDEGPRATEWLGQRVVKQHRTIGTTLALLRRAGFDVFHLEEWGPSPAQVAAHPQWAEERERPLFMLVACSR